MSPRSWPDYQALQVPMLFRHIVEQAHIGVAIFQEGRIVYCNRCFQQWVGCPGEDRGYGVAGLVPVPPDAHFPLVHHQPVRLEQVLPGIDYESLLACHWPPTRGDQTPGLCRSERQLNGQNGAVMEVEFYASVIDFNDRPAVLTFMRDITERKQMEHHLKASEARYRSLFDHVPMGLCRFSAEGNLLDANPALVGMFGFSDRDSFLAANTLKQSTASQAWQTCLSQSGPLKQCELQLCRQDGRNLWVRVIARAVTQINGQVVYYEGAVEDITEIRAAQAALEELAIRDSLTHVYNRRHFFEVTKREIARASRFNHATSLLLIDIDHFKQVNDTHGHLIGDRVLQNVVLRLRENLRQSDILARYGGEEFIVLMPETNASQAWYGAERLRRVVADKPFSIGQGDLAVTISLGVTSWLPSVPLPSLDSLIDQADQALYRAKQGGRNRTETALTPACCTRSI
jgi:diguanylate cyclase (GGDEF)-like protein/PAS domain S-box-containing protein